MAIFNTVYGGEWHWKPGANTLAYFPLKENQNDVLNNYTLPLTGTQEQIGFTFNKSGDQTITINSSQRFVSCWVKFNSYLSSGAQILSACDGGPFYNYYNSYSDANKRFQVYNGNSRVFNSDQIQTNANTWYHYAVGWDGTKVVCYLNGSKVAEGTCNVNVGTSCRFIRSINVTFSELIYESAVRTATEVSDYYNKTKSKYGQKKGWKPGANTIAYYPFETDVNDYSGNNRNLTNSGVTFSGGVGVWNGSSRAYRTWDYQLSTGYTVSAWEKSTVNNTSYIIDMRNDYQYGQGMGLMIENGYFKATQQKSYNSEEEYTRTRDGNRNHWVMTWTGSVWTVYFNGMQVKQATIDNSINTTNGTILSFGGRYKEYYGSFGYFTGNISRYIVENKVWSADEILAYYNQTKSNYGL